MTGRTYTPDRWVIVQVTLPSGEKWFKVFGGWYGGFTQGDSWKMSSGIVKVVEFPTMYHFHNASGSIYVCYKGTLSDGSRGGDQGMSGLMSGVFQHYKEQIEQQGGQFDVVDPDVVQLHVPVERGENGDSQ